MQNLFEKEKIRIPNEMDARRIFPENKLNYSPEEKKTTHAYETARLH